MATTDKAHDTGSLRNRSPLGQGAIVLGIYIAMYLTVAGVLHVVTAFEASSSASASALPANTQTTPPGESLDPVTESPDSSPLRATPEREDHVSIESLH